MRHPLLVPVALVFAAFMAFTVTIYWAGTQENIVAGFAEVMARPWGKVAIIDLYMGFALGALWIWCVEPRRWLAILLIIMIVGLGNLVTFGYLFWRGLRARTLREWVLGWPLGEASPRERTRGEGPTA